MKKVVALSIVAIATALAAAPASAQSVSGTVTINGTVGEKCLVTDTGANPNADFGGIVNLGALDAADGRLRTIAAIAATGDLANLGFRVVCTTANPLISVTATPLTTAAAPPAGYANRVDFTADVDFDTVSGTDQYTAVTDATATVGGNLTDRLATGLDNVRVDLRDFNTPGVNDVLVAGSYTGSVSITIAPN
jgi:hypothetical protein